MSEIKITKNSIANGIISNGLVTIGSIDNTDLGNSNIVSNSSGSMAIGYIDGISNNNDGASISATGLGSFASGYAYIDSSYRGNNETLEYHNVIANGNGAHAEGCGTYAGLLYAHAEGYDTSANGNGTHAEGFGTYAGMMLYNSLTKARGLYEQLQNKIQLDTTAADELANNNILINNHIYYVTSTKGADVIILSEDISDEDINWAQTNFILIINNMGDYAHAEGYETTATGNFSHAGGKGTIANREAMTAIGKYNVSRMATTLNTLFVVGDGTSSATIDRSDAFRVNSIGAVTGTNSVPSSVQAKVNGVSDVYLGCPIGTIVMWAGETAPEGWFICDGSKILIKGNKNIEQTILNKNILKNELATLIDIMLINGSTQYGSFTTVYNDTTNKYVKTYSINETNITILEWTTTVNNAAALYLNSDTSYTFYYNSSEITVTRYYTMLLPDFLKKFPLGAQENSSIGSDQNYWKTDLGTGSIYAAGEAAHILTKNEMPLHNHSFDVYEGHGDAKAWKVNGDEIKGTVYTSSTGKNYPHNNIPPFLAINFIIKYK